MTKNVMPKGEVFPQIKNISVDLPPRHTERWVPRRKATIVNAVHSGVMSPEEFAAVMSCRLKSLSPGSARLRPTVSRDCMSLEHSFIGVLLVLGRRTIPKRRSRLAGFSST